jgi:hypothetical protein
LEEVTVGTDPVALVLLEVDLVTGNVALFDDTDCASFSIVIA